MGTLLIIEPKAIVAIQSNVGSDTGVDNLKTPDPKEVWTASSHSTRNLDIDIGEAIEADSFLLGYTNATDTGEMVVQSATGLGTGLVTLDAYSDIRPDDAAGERVHGFRHLAAPVTSRYWRIGTRLNVTPLQAGVLIIGKAFKTEWDKEWGSGRRVIDTGKATQLPSGGFGVEGGARKAAFKWSFGDLTDAETRDLYDLQMRLGLTSPLVVVENSGETVGVDQQIHYGLFSRLDEYERRRHNETKWQLEIEQWI